MKKKIALIALLLCTYSGVNAQNFDFINIRGEVIFSSNGANREDALVNHITSTRRSYVSDMMPVVIDGIVLDGYNFTQGPDLEYVGLGDTVYKNCLVMNSTFNNALMVFAKFVNCRFINNTFGGTLSGVTFKGGEFVSNRFVENSTMKNFTFINVNSDVSLRPMTPGNPRIMAEHINASRNVMARVDFENLVIFNSGFNKTDFTKSNLSNAVFSHSILDGSIFDAAVVENIQQLDKNSCIDCQSSPF